MDTAGNGILNAIITNYLKRLAFSIDAVEAIAFGVEAGNAGESHKLSRICHLRNAPPNADSTARAAELLKSLASSAVEARGHQVTQITFPTGRLPLFCIARVLYEDPNDIYGAFAFVVKCKTSLDAMSLADSLGGKVVTD